MRQILTLNLVLALALLVTGCIDAVPSTDQPIEAFQLQAEVEATQGDRIRVRVHFDLCDTALRRIDLQGGDRVEATLGNETLELHEPWFSYPPASYVGTFPRGSSGSELRIDLIRAPGSRAVNAATVRVPTAARIVSPRRTDRISRSFEDLEVQWKPLRGEDSDGGGADRALWSVQGTRRCSSEEATPDFSGEVTLTPGARDFMLPAGTLALPALAGDEVCKSELVVQRVNDGEVSAGFCAGSAIRATRVNARNFRSTP